MLHFYPPTARNPISPFDEVSIRQFLLGGRPGNVLDIRLAGGITVSYVHSKPKDGAAYIVEVGGQLIEAKKVVVNAASRPVIKASKIDCSLQPTPFERDRQPYFYSINGEFKVSFPLDRFSTYLICRDITGDPIKILSRERVNGYFFRFLHGKTRNRPDDDYFSLITRRS